MKAEFDKEIDALLRRSLRAAAGGARAPEAARATPHLDADELSAFAEHALPAPARLAAVSHLADCDECRGAVVTLSRAAGEPARRAAVPASVDPSEAVPSGGWLAALFSPRLMRFVAPALALCLVGAVAFVLLRTGREGGSVAQFSRAPEAARPGLTGGDASTSANINTSAGTAADATDNIAAGPPPAAPTSPAGQERREPPGAAPESEAPDGSEGRARSELARPQAEEVVAREDAPAPAPPSAAAPAEAVPVASTPAPRDAAKEKQDDRRKAADDGEGARVYDGQQERRAQLGNLEGAQQSPDGSRNRSSNSASGGGTRSAPAAPRREADRSSRSITGPRARGESREEEKAAAGDERAAAGHRFRREGSAWVDVNYRPSMAMTGVRRGTEAFRALVADIPELGRIAEQLSGEVITVVRGRAYRIR